MRSKIGSCELLDKIINKTPVAEVDNASPASLLASNLCNPHPHNTLELRVPIPLTLKAIAPNDLVYPISVANGISKREIVVKAAAFSPYPIAKSQKLDVFIACERVYVC